MQLKQFCNIATTFGDLPDWLLFLFKLSNDEGNSPHKIDYYRTTTKHTKAQTVCTLLWRHNGLDCVFNHQPHECLLNRLFGHRSKKTSKFRVTGLCVGNSPETGEFPAQMASNAENASIRWCHHDISGDVRYQPSVTTAHLIHLIYSPGPVAMEVLYFNNSMVDVQ